MSSEEFDAVASGDTIAVVPPSQSKPTGLHSPPDSNNAMKLDGSDSELSDLDDALAADLMRDQDQADNPPPTTSTSVPDQPPPQAEENPEQDDIGEVLPAEWSGNVPIFRPSMAQFRDFKRFMEKVDCYGMKSGIIKIIPPQEWTDSLPPKNDQIKTIRVREPIKQDIMGSNGTYRQVNILHQRSYNLPQWRQLCDQSEHQPPARRGERRANADKPKPPPKPKPTATVSGSTPAPSTRGRRGRRGGARGRGRSAMSQKEATAEPEQRPMTPESPRPPEGAEENMVVDTVENDPGIKVEEEDDEGSPVIRRMGSVGPKSKTQSTSARRKYSKREGSVKIDEAAFKDWDYRMDISDYTPERCEELERIYWKTLTYAQPLYGADLLGTLFDESTELWNLNKLPNLLDVLGTKVPGVNTAYLYLGMWKATFAWHLEDVDLYSINYLHFGAPKQWYSISQADARRFEAAMKSIWPTEAKACDQFLRHKAFLISPSHLQQYYNIKVNKCVSYPGEFVVTYPYGYHSGYNLGYNCAEAVNFALDTWLPMGKIAKRCECAQAQDSVWVDVYEIERKLRGESTEYEETDYDDDEDDEDDDNDVTMAGLPTPPSGLVVRLKAGGGRKRKRATGDKTDGDRPKIKKIRLRLRPHVEPPCCLCPNTIPGAEILPTDDGRKVHRLCALYLPEPYIETVDSEEVVANVGGIPKARQDLKCLFCRSKRGACFQCSQKKCVRSYHATCAAAAGVFVESGDVPVFGEDGTEYKELAFEFSCRFHRAKRDKKLDSIGLEGVSRIRDAAAALKVGAICQAQYHRGEIFAGVVAENRADEQMLLLDVIPHGDRVEVEWKYLLLPDPSEYRLPKASANALPMPTTRKAKAELNATRGEERPRADDVFVEGFTWAEFHTCEKEECCNPEQVRPDLSKDSQVWFYLPKTSTDLRPQYTDDPLRQVHNPKSNFLDTVPRPPPARRASVSVASSGEPRRSYTPIPLPKLPPGVLKTEKTDKTEKPYVYKPRKSSFDVQFSPQTFVPKPGSMPPPGLPASQTPSAAAGAAASSATPQAAGKPSLTLSTASLSGRPAVGTPLGPPPPRASWSKASTPTATPRRNSVAGVTGLAGQQTIPRQQSKVPLPPYVQLPPPRQPNQQHHRASQRKQHQPKQEQQRVQPSSLAQKYPFFQVNHNRDSAKYRTPYATWGGFTNGYEGNVRSLLMSGTAPRASFHRRGNSFGLGGAGLQGLTKPARYLNYNDAKDSLSPNSTFKFPNPQSDAVLQSPTALSLDMSLTSPLAASPVLEQSPLLHSVTPPPPSFLTTQDEFADSLMESWDLPPTATAAAPLHPAIRPQFGGSSMWASQPFIGPLLPLSMSQLGPLGSMGSMGPMGPPSQVGPFANSADVVFTTPALVMSPTTPTPPPMSPLAAPSGMQSVPSTPPGSSHHVPHTPTVPNSPASVASTVTQTPEEQLKQQLRRISDPPPSSYRFRCLHQPKAARHRSRSSLSGFSQLQGQILNLYPSIPNDHVPSST